MERYYYERRAFGDYEIFDRLRGQEVLARVYDVDLVEKIVAALNASAA